MLTLYEITVSERHVIVNKMKTEILEQFSRSHALYNRGLNMDGLTEQEIADKVGYKTASAVHKRIAKIAGAYEDYVTAEYQKYLDK